MDNNFLQVYFLGGLHEKNGKKKIQEKKLAWDCTYIRLAAEPSMVCRWRRELLVARL